MNITREVASKVLETVDAGLSSGLGEPEPGKMCVEAAVNYALGLPHGDKPSCVAPVLRNLKIALNDRNWSSPQARAKGLRRLALVQLGSVGALDEKLFLERVVEMTIRKILPRAMRSAAKFQRIDKHRHALEDVAQLCEREGTRDAALKAKDAAAYAAYATAAAARNHELSFFAEEVVQILINMNAPGAKWLDLCPAEEIAP